MSLVNPNGIPIDLLPKPGVLDDCLNKFSKKPVFYESMTRVLHKSGGTMRVWRTYDVMPEYADAEVIEWIKQVPATATMPEIVRHMGFLKRISAIELIDQNGLGGVAYYEWDSPGQKAE